MYKLTIRAVGKPQDAFHQQSIHSTVERLKPYARVEVQEIPEGHKGSAKPNVKKTQETEANNLLKNIPPGSVIVALDETGKEYDSVTFAKKLDEWSGNGRSVFFLIGGSWGLDPTVRAKADTILSLSKMTLPHALARVILLEQLYRAITILSGKEYHK